MSSKYVVDEGFRQCSEDEWLNHAKPISDPSLEATNHRGDLAFLKIWRARQMTHKNHKMTHV
jgi:hypothetical protein